MEQAAAIANRLQRLRQRKTPRLAVWLAKSRVSFRFAGIILAVQHVWASVSHWLSSMGRVKGGADSSWPYAGPQFDQFQKDRGQGSHHKCRARTAGVAGAAASVSAATADTLLLILLLPKLNA